LRTPKRRQSAAMSDRRSAISGGMGAPSGFPVERGLSYGRFGESK
jgi:hypothetical protein